MPNYDAVIIGSGPNGLAAGIELARNKLKVLILESSETIGGGTRTVQLTLEGFNHDQCSAVHPLAVCSPYLKTLPLADHGLNWIHPPVSVAHPLDDGPAILQTKSFDDMDLYLGGDAKAWRRLFQVFDDKGEKLLEDLLAPIKWPNEPTAFLKFGLNAMKSAKNLAYSKFKNERTRALFAGNAAHSVMPLDFSFSSAIALVLIGAGHIKNWPVPQGGSSAISNALASYFKSMGGEIETGIHIKEYSELPSANYYFFDTSPHQLASIAKEQLPSSYRKKLLNFNMGPGVFKLDWALNESIPWKDLNCLKASTVHIGGSFAEIAESEKLMWNGKHSDKPFIILCQQSEFDSSRAPKGKHTGYAYCHVPHGSTKNMTEIIESQIERFAPGFKEIILARHTTNTSQFQELNPNLIGGAITGGSSNLGQLFARPVLKLNPYSTPNDKIYICSASTPPGGGVHGMNGYWAAKKLLDKI